MRPTSLPVPAITFEEAFALAANLARVRAPMLHPGPHAMRAMAVLMKGAERFVTLPPAFTPEALRVLAGTTYFGSNEKAVRELGFTARPLDEGLAQTLEHELRLLGRV